jgi:hypothetical protein
VCEKINAVIWTIVAKQACFQDGRGQSYRVVFDAQISVFIGVRINYVV